MSLFPKQEASGTQLPEDSQQPWCPCPDGGPAHQLLPGERPALLHRGGFLAKWRRGTVGPSWVLACSVGTMCSVLGHEDASFPDLLGTQILMVPGPASGSSRSAPVIETG